MKKAHIVITVLLFILGALCYIFFEALHTKILEDELANTFLCGFISRFGLGILFVWLLFMFGGRKILGFDKKFFRNMVWSLPCFMVAFVNIPYHAIATGTATVDRGDLIGLYILYVFGIALLEELIFRGVIVLLASDYLKNNRHVPLLITLISASVFSLFHLTNLFFGAGIGDVLLQCLYTFLIGAMLTVTMLKLNNVWLCVLIHTIFDFGGLLIIHIGSGNPWDTVFWVLTIVSGVLCAGHIIYSLIKLEKDYVSE